MATTSITPKQCAAARALIGWSQDKLAEAAQVARATIANFENHARLDPSQKNLISIKASLEQAGVQFIPEDVSAGLGPGVRLRQLQLEYSNRLRPDGWHLIFPVRFKEQDCLVTITREIIDDIVRGNLATPADRVKVVERRLPEFLGAVEKHLSETAQVPREITLTMSDFPPGTF
jgi:transcriptional regulator with XRE-family HTH domain